MNLGQLLAAVVDYPEDTRVFFQDADDVVWPAERVEESPSGDLIVLSYDEDTERLHRESE